MNDAIRIAHCFGAILTGVVILVLAAAICISHGSVVGVALAFLGLVSGYFVGVLVTGNQHPRVIVALALTSWASTGLAVLAAIISLI
ncbi:MAG: hypothetical protein EOR00_09440 [Mesorhizobium sp.]|uniref:hypothetical protein n=1 Tax=Mesorhizobium sp. TaxID=1871066 RepID=UPI000FE9A1CC|nr:hypothetical protein [Mesorhizobium sp.]RWP18851.1 MAG: hypothetical protein EOR00_09440 [Mesorhizobium sp.]